ncbi:MAG: copper-binding protein [Candidatus Accumulibacter sp.]|jgi:Cu/Ag efflux protein CusF|nr:copper-binding protein [Accumulibacter sp.]
MKKSFFTAFFFALAFFIAPIRADVQVHGSHDSHSSHGSHSSHSSHSAHGHGARDEAAPPELVAGVVRRVDKAAGKITLSHGPLAGLGMPAMTMSFRVKDAAWLDRVHAGDKVRFAAESINGALTVVRLETSE